MSEVKYKLFNEGFVYFMWNPILKGRKCFCSEKISDLIQQIENNNVSKLCEIYGFNKEGFDCCDSNRKSHKNNFVYFDPLYDIKVGFLNGEQIQVRYKDNDYWVDTEIPEDYLDYYDDDFELRVKPKKSFK